MRDLDLKSLRLFAAVCEAGNIKRAARQALIEPSAISKRMAQLEAAMGVPLLLRGRRGVQPTVAGLTLLEHARSLAWILERIENDASAFAAGVRGQVRLVASASAVAESLLDDIAAFMRAPEHQQIQVDIEERLSSEVVRQVREGRASLGVCWDGVDLGGLGHGPYREDALVLAVPPDHALAGRARIRFDQTLDFTHVGLSPDTAVYAMLHRQAARAGRLLTHRVVVSNFDAALRVVKAGLGISVIPQEVAAPRALAGELALVPLEDAWARRRFVICYRDPASLSPAARRLSEFLAAQAAAAEEGS